MSERFSSALRLSDLNDFIAPSQACVVNLARLQTSDFDSSTPKDARTLQKRVIQAPSAIKAEPVKITLHDCLACSGCITSAETVMLEQQSTSELELRLKSSESAVVVSLSPQSRAALATHFGLPPLQVFRKLTSLLKSLGAKAVFDTSFSRDLSLMESCAEFVERYKVAYLDGKSSLSKDDRDSPGPLPMLSSSCPGWICYAEKTHGEYILPYISTAKSPQQIMGAIVKRYFSKTLGLKPDQIYHVTIMPCYDKKLEASRDDFLFDLDSRDDGSHGCEYETEAENGIVYENGAIHEGNNVTELSTAGFRTETESREKRTERKRKLIKKKIAEVDCVITSGELLELLENREVDFPKLPESPLDRICSNVDENGHLFGVKGGSGGFAENIFAYAARTLFGQEIRDDQVQWKTLRNADFKEVFLEVNGKQVLSFACAYGFRNIQNLVRKIKSKRCNYHFVEIMACPGGCLSGGGQIKMKKGKSLKDHLLEIEAAYSQEVEVKDPFENPLAKRVYNEWLNHPFSDESRQILHTAYHHRKPSISSNLTNW